MTLSETRLPIRTARLELRELLESDFEAVHAYASDPVVVRFMPWGPNSESETVAFLARARDLAAAVPRLGYELAVVQRETDQLLGAMGLHRADASADEAMLGYCFNRSAWGQGYATEAARAMVSFGFDGLGLASVWAGCDVDNVGSVRVLEKIGMTLVPEHAKDGDSLMFRVESKEWGA